MISSTQINSDSAAIQSLFSTYKSEIATLNNDEVWKGSSKNNFIQQSENFVSEFMSTMKQQLAIFATAIDNHERYVEAKANYETSEKNYNVAKANEDYSSANEYKKQMAEYSRTMEALKKNINSQIVEISGMKVETTSAKEMFIKDFHLNEFVYYRQGDYTQKYGKSGTIASSGCGPTAAAMVLTYLTGETVTPVETADYSVKNGFRVEGNGTYDALFPSIAEEYGLKCTKQDQTINNIETSLSEGNVIIAHMGKGEFTNDGHYIVLRETDGKGNVLVADPANPSRNKWYPSSIIQAQAKGSMYSFNVI